MEKHMNVKMSEYYQGTDAKGVLLPEKIQVAVLEPGKEYEVDAALGKWLVENGKALEVKPKHYGAQPEPQARADDVVFEDSKPKRSKK